MNKLTRREEKLLKVSIIESIEKSLSEILNEKAVVATFNNVIEIADDAVESFYDAVDTDIAMDIVRKNISNLK